jgi:predicted amidohydrolase
MVSINETVEVGVADAERKKEDLPRRVRLAVVQYELRPISSFHDFAQQCSFFVKTAAGYKADFVLFPELFTTQLLTFIDATPSTVAHKLDEVTPQYVELFAELARSTRTYIIAGSHLVKENGTLYNISYFFDREGRYGKQYKLHITPHEKDAWGVEPGNTVEVFDTDCGKISILICYDVEFPELSRIAVSKGANIIFVPSNTDQRFGYLRVRYCSQARCIENQVYVAVTGCTGNTPMLGSGEIHYSQAAIFTPSDLPFPQGAVAAECAENVETMIIQDLDLSLLEENRQKGAVRPWMERRKDLYEIHYRDASGKQVKV